MHCGQCQSDDTKVLESRLSTDGKSVRRRRVCRHCSHRFTTYEKEEALEIHVKKKDGHIEPYSREKALRSIQIACRKRKIKIEEVAFMLRRIEVALQELGERVISSRQLGDLIMASLSELDQVAYIRFASVYKDFKNPGEFYAVLKSLNKQDDAGSKSPSFGSFSLRADENTLSFSS